VTQKALKLKECEAAKDKMESDKALVDSGQMTRENVPRHVPPLPGCLTNLSFLR